METIQFKTNIKCSGCIAKVTPELNKTAGADNWQVDLQSADRILTVTAENTTPENIQQALQKVGYHAEQVN